MPWLPVSNRSLRQPRNDRWRALPFALASCPMTDTSEDLTAEIRALRKEVAKLNEHRFIKVQNSTPRLLWFQLLRGLALGLGTVIGASALVSLVAFALAQIDFIPIVGEWAADLARQIEAEVTSDQSTPPTTDN